MTGSPAASGQIAACIVREALRFDPLQGDATALRVTTRLAIDGLSRAERNHVVTLVAFIAASFAKHLSDDVRESVLAAMELPVEQARAVRDLLVRGLEAAVTEASL